MHEKRTRVGQTLDWVFAEEDTYLLGIKTISSLENSLNTGETWMKTELNNCAFLGVARQYSNTNINTL